MDGNSIIFQLKCAKVSRIVKPTVKLSVMGIVRRAANCTSKRSLLHEPVIKPKLIFV